MRDDLKQICAYLQEFAHHEILYIERKIDKIEREKAYLLKKKEVYRRFFIRLNNIYNKEENKDGKDESNSNNSQK